MRELKYNFSEAQIAAAVKDEIDKNITQSSLEFTRSNNNILINIPGTEYHNKNFQDLDNSNNREHVISEVQKRLAVDETKATQIVNHFTGFLDYFQITLFEKNGLLFNLTLPQQSLGKITEDLQHKEFFKVNGDVYYKCREQLFLEFNNKKISLGEIEYTYRVDEERYTMTSIACSSEQLKNLLADPARFTNFPKLIFNLARENLLGRADVTVAEIQKLIDLARHLNIAPSFKDIKMADASAEDKKKNFDALNFEGVILTTKLVADILTKNTDKLKNTDLRLVDFNQITIPDEFLDQTKNNSPFDRCILGKRQVDFLGQKYPDYLGNLLRSADLREINFPGLIQKLGATERQYLLTNVTDFSGSILDANCVKTIVFQKNSGRLTGAILNDIDFKDIDLSNANLTGCVINKNTKFTGATISKNSANTRCEFLNYQYTDALGEVKTINIKSEDLVNKYLEAIKDRSFFAKSNFSKKLKKLDRNVGAQALMILQECEKGPADNKDKAVENLLASFGVPTIYNVDQAAIAKLKDIALYPKNDSKTPVTHWADTLMRNLETISIDGKFITADKSLAEIAEIEKDRANTASNKKFKSTVEDWIEKSLKIDKPKAELIFNNLNEFFVTNTVTEYPKTTSPFLSDPIHLQASNDPSATNQFDFKNINGKITGNFKFSQILMNSKKALKLPLGETSFTYTQAADGKFELSGIAADNLFAQKIMSGTYAKFTDPESRKIEMFNDLKPDLMKLNFEQANIFIDSLFADDINDTNKITPLLTKIKIKFLTEGRLLALSEIGLLNTESKRLNNADLILQGAKLAPAKLNFEQLKLLQAKGVDVTHADISDIDFSKEKLFKPFNLKGIKLTDMQVHDLSKSLNTAGFIAGANLSFDKLSGTVLCGAHIPGTNFSRSILFDADFSSIQSKDKVDSIPEYVTNLVGANFREANLDKAKFIGADLRKANFTDATLSNTDFSDADLRGAKINAAYFEGINLTGARLDRDQIAFLASKPELRHHIRTLDLTGLDLTGIDLTDVDLSGVNLNTVKIGEGDGCETIIFGVDDQGVNIKGIESLKTETRKLSKQFKFKSIEEELKTQMRLNLYVNTLKKQSHNNLSEEQIKNIVEFSKTIGADLNKIAGLANTNFTFKLDDIEATENHNVLYKKIQDIYYQKNGKLLPSTRSNLFAVIDYAQKNPTSDTAKAFDHVKNDLLNDAKGISKEKTDRARFDALLKSCQEKKLFTAEQLDELVVLVSKYKIDISKIVISSDTKVEFACYGLNENNDFPVWSNTEMIKAFKAHRNRPNDPVRNFLDLAVHAAKDNADSLSEISKAYNAARYSLLKNNVKSASIDNGSKIFILGQAATALGINPVDFSDLTFSGVNLSRLDLSNTIVDGADFTGMTVSQETNWDGTVFCKTDHADSKTDYAKCDSFTYLFKDGAKVAIAKDKFLEIVDFKNSGNDAGVLFALQVLNTNELKNARENLYTALKDKINTPPINTTKIAQLASAAKELNVPLDLSDLDLTGLNLSKIDLTGAIMRDAKVSGTKFNSTNMKALDFSEAKIGDFRFLNVFGPEKQIITFLFRNNGSVASVILKNGAGNTVKKDILSNGLDTLFTRFNPADGTNEAKLREIAQKTSAKKLFKACDDLFKPVANTSAPSQPSLSLEGVSQLFLFDKSNTNLSMTPEAKPVTPPPVVSVPEKFDQKIDVYWIKSSAEENQSDDLEIRTKVVEGWGKPITISTSALFEKFSSEYINHNKGFVGFFKPNFLNTLKGTETQKLQVVLKEVGTNSKSSIIHTALIKAMSELVNGDSLRSANSTPDDHGVTPETTTRDSSVPTPGRRHT